MKYRIDYELTHDIDFFFKYEGKYYHAASNGQRLPREIDRKNNIILQMKLELLPAMYEVSWSKNFEGLRFDFDLSSFAFFAERGFISLDRIVAETDEFSPHFCIVAMPSVDAVFMNEDLLSLIPSIEKEKIFIE